MIVIALVTALVYAGSVRNGFVDYDDGGLILKSDISHGLTPSNLKKAFTRYDPELYIPLTFVGYQLDYSIAGLNPWIYHMHSVLLHALAAVFVALTCYLLSGRNLWVGVVTGLLYALHPIQAEAVLWASARKDVQAAAFFWMSAFCYLRYRELSSREMSWPWYAGSLAMFLLAILSKVSVIVFPMAILLFDYYQDGWFTRKSLLRSIPFWAVSGVFGVVAMFGKGDAGTGLPLEKALIGARAVVLYLTGTFLPVGFSVLYPFTKPLSAATPELLYSLLLVAGVTVAAVLASKRWKLFVFTWFFFLLCLLPSFTNFAKGVEVPLDVYIGSDRYALLGVAAVFFGVAVLLNRLQSHTAVIVPVLVLLAILTFRQVGVWNNTESLFTHALAYHPDAHTAHNNIGGVLFNRREYQRAIAEYQAALAIRPTAITHYNLGQVYRELGQVDLAVSHYQEAVKLNPKRADALVNLGVIYLERQQYAKAADMFQEAEAADRTLAAVPFNLGLAYEALGKKDLAIKAFERALEMDPNDSEAAEHLKKLQ